MNTQQFKNIDEYIAGFPKETQAILEQVRDTVKKSRTRCGRSHQIRHADVCVER